MLNKVQLIGNLGQDPEIKNLDGGNKIANFSVATSESYTSKSGEKVTNTEWHRCVVYGKGAEIIEKYVKKGSRLYLEGSIKTRSWDDKDGVKKYATEITVRDFKFLSSADNSAAPQQEPNNAPASNDDHDDLPF